MSKILIIDDEEDLVSLLKDSLEERGHVVSVAFDGDNGLNKAREQPDLIILDIMMPGLNGYEVCRKIRDEVLCPILFLSAKQSEMDKVKGLATGGDDYIVKPFSLRELLARIDAHLRREKRAASLNHSNQRVLIRFGRMEIDLRSRQVKIDGKVIPFTKKEFDILEFFALHSGQVFSKEQIYEKVWGYDAEGDSSTVTEHVKKIRAKIAAMDPDTEYISTVWGIGYRFNKIMGNETMGEGVSMLERKPLKSQFVITFILILISSIIATIATYCAGYLIFINLQYKKIYPANYFEKNMPEIENDIRNKGTKALNPEEKKELEKIIPVEGISYQVMDASGNKIYGTDNRRLVKNKEEFYRKINSNIAVNGKYTSLIPVIDADGKIEGGVALTYTLTPYFPNSTDQIWITPLFMAILFSPFIYIVIFTLFFSKKFVGNIGKPVNMLIDAARKVKEKDLDFHIDYHADNELGKLCEAFNDMKNKLKESLMSQWRAEQERHEMVAALAHDLQTPFSTILAYVESLLEGIYDKQKIEKYLHVIKENANKGANLIKEMLYAAELEHSGAMLDVAPVDIDSFLMRIKESYEMMARKKKISINVEVNHKYHDQKRCPVDEAKLERILDNIILNSLRYTPEQGKITIHAEVADEHVRFTVCDSGKGFSNKDLSNLFNKFYRGDESRSSKNGHAGLGLYIAKKLVEMHGGKIEAWNAKNGGACIEFVLQFLT